MAASANAVNIVNQSVVNRGINRSGMTRAIFRWIHILFGIPILGYIYDSPSDTHYYAASIRYFIVPVLLLSGLWMWKGHVVRRLISKRSA
jgi:hypothetical protein